MTAAENAKTRGDQIVAVFSLGGLCGSAREEGEAGRLCNVTAYPTADARKLADLVVDSNARYDL